jgi:class 3 adenylate cyclase
VKSPTVLFFSLLFGLSGICNTCIDIFFEVEATASCEYYAFLGQDTLSYPIERSEAIKEINAYLSDYVTLKHGDPRKALKAAKDASKLAEATFSNATNLSNYERSLWQQSEALLGEAYFEKGRYLEADEHWQKVYEISESIQDPILAEDLAKSRSQLDSVMENMKFTKAKQWLHDIDPIDVVGEEIVETNSGLMARMEMKLFRTYAGNGMTETAEKHFQKAVSIYEELENDEALERIHAEYDAWEKEDLDSTIESIKVQKDTLKAVLPSKKLLSLIEEAESIENSSELKGSSALLKRYKELQQAIAEEEKRNEIAFLEKENQLENQEREILLLEQENELGVLSLAQERAKIEEATQKRRNLSIGLALISALALSLFFLNRNKTRSNQRLTEAKNALAEAKDRISSLLQQQVSGDVAHTLIHGEINAVQSRFVSVMFADIRNFTPKVAHLKPEEIIQYQNDIFGFMIDIIEAHHGNINQLLGDGFMATFGAPKSSGNDVQNAVDAAQAILKKLSEVNQEGNIPPTEIGIGIDCGMAVMGNVGNASRKQFSITGNVVISAARIEQTNKLLGSNFLISEEVLEKSSISSTLKEHSVPLKGREGKRTLFQVQ